MLLNKFFPIVDTCVSCEDTARPSCGMAPRWRLVGDVLCVCSAVLLEVPHFASLRDAGREVCVLRSDNGVSWYEHQTRATTDDSISDVLDSKQLARISSRRPLTHRISVQQSRQLLASSVSINQSINQFFIKSCHTATNTSIYNAICKKST